MNRHREVVLLSHSLTTATPVYGGATGRIEISRTRSMECGDSCEASRISLDNHVGTHIDFPAHFCTQGKRSHDFSAAFWHFSHVSLFRGSAIELMEQVSSLDPKTEILLLKTGYERHRGEKRYWEEQPPFEPALAEQLRNRCPDLRVFGFDMISLSSFGNRELGREAHRAFLCKSDIVLIEDMALSELNESPRALTVAPWQIDGLDGSPCTVYAYV